MIEEAVVDSSVTLYAGLQSEMLSNTLLSRLTETNTLLVVTSQLTDGRRQRAGIPCRHNHPRIAVIQRLGIAANIRCDYRKAGRHILNHGIGKPFFMRRQQSYVCRRE